MAAKSTPATSIVEALTSFTARIGDQDVPIRKGDLADADAAVVRRYPAMFGPVGVRFASSRVEQATAAPGEKRGA